MKILNSFFCFLFIISAGLQYNDADPYLWIPIYLTGASISFFAIRNTYFPRLSLFLIALFTGYCVFLFFSKNGVLTWLFEHQLENIAVGMKASTPWIENTREFFGLIILSSVILFNYLAHKKMKTAHELI
jgi:hypothetical protein